jgi:hypothetical protein
MAHFAELDENNVVKRVVVIANDIPTAAGPLGENDMHVDGETHCQKFFKGGVWKQTSYNDNFRKQYAGPGYIYDVEKDKFIEPQPHASWTLDANGDWQAPITYPTIIDDGVDPSVWHYLIVWNETKYQADNNTGWEARKSNDDAAGGYPAKTVYNWNGTAWIAE